MHQNVQGSTTRGRHPRAKPRIQQPGERMYERQTKWTLTDGTGRHSATAASDTLMEVTGSSEPHRPESLTALPAACRATDFVLDHRRNVR